MGRYEAYVLRMQRLAKAWHFVLRHKFIILGVTAAALATTAALMGTKGIVTEAVPLAPTYVYGEPIDYSASAFMSGVSYEYAPKGTEDWTGVQPTDVGDYQVRVVTEGSFGKKYGAPQVFTISPAKTEVTFAEKAIFYGDKLTPVASLLPGHILKEATPVIEKYKAETEVYGSNAVIVDEQGADVTHNYAVSYPRQTLTIKPRTIEFKQADSAFTYDGIGHDTSDDVSIVKGSLVEGDQFFFQPALTEKNVGKYSLGGEITIKNGEDDRTALYDITLTKGNTTINKRQTTISSVDFTKTYDGLPVTTEERGTVSISNKVEGETFNAELANDHNTWIAPGTYPNEFTYELQDESNYEVHLTKGTVRINNRPLHIHIEGTRSYQGSYLGGELKANEYSFLDDTSLAAGDALILTVAETEVLKTSPKYEYHILRDETDVTAYYDVTLDGGIVFEKRSLVATGSVDTLTYDGKTHTLSWSLEGELDSDEVKVKWGSATNDELKVYETRPTFGTELTKPGFIYAKPVLESIKNKEDESDRSMYYEYSQSLATLTIEKRNLEVLLQGNRTYDGSYSLYKPLEETEYSFQAGTTLAEGETFSIWPKPATIFDANVQYEYRIENESGVDVTDCYDVHLADESLIEFHKHKVTITPFADEIVYDGKSHSLRYTTEGDDLSYNEMPEAYTYVWDEKDTSLTDVGEISSTVSLNKVLSPALGNMDVTAFYDCDPQNSSLKITKRPLHITLTSHRTYNGNNTSYWFNQNSSEVVIESGTDKGLAEGHTLTLTVKDDKSGLNLLKGEEIEFEVKVFDMMGMDVTKNYEPSITFDVTMDKAEKLTADLRPGLAEGEHYYHSERSVPALLDLTGLQSNDRFLVSVAGTRDGAVQLQETTWYYDYDETYGVDSMGKAGSYHYEITSIDVVRNEESRLFCYEGLAMNPSFDYTIHKRPINIFIYENGSDPSTNVTSSAGDGYDGNPLGSDRIKVTVIPNGDGYYAYEYDIVDQYGSSVIENYEILSEYIGPYPQKSLTITCRDKNFTFGPEYQADSSWYDVSVDGLTITWASGSAPSNSKFYEVTAEPISYGGNWKISKIQDSTGLDVTAVYDVNIIPATVSIAKRSLSINIFGSRTYAGQLLSSALVSAAEYSTGGDGLFYQSSKIRDTLTVSPLEDTILDNGDFTDGDVEFTYKITNASTQKDVTAFYDVTLTSTMEFRAKEVSISATPDELIKYDKKKHTPTIVIDPGIGTDKVIYEYADDVDPTVQAPGDSHDYTITGVHFTDKDGNDRDKYYKPTIVAANGNITVDAAVVELYLGDYKGIYDGVTSYNIRDYEAAIRNKISVIPSQDGHYPDPSSLQFKDFYVSALGTTSLGEDCVDKDSLVILDENGEDVTKNYTITVVTGSVTLVPFSVEVWAQSLNKTYDGNPLALQDKNAKYKIDVSSEYTWGSIGDYTVVVEFDGESITNAGSTTSTVTQVYVYKDGVLVDPSAYSVSAIHEATLTVNQRSITIYTGNFTDEVGWEVDPSSAGYGLSKGTLVKGDTLVVVHAPTKKVYYETGSYENSDWVFAIYNANGEDVTGNYNISYQWGTITIIEE